MAYWREVEAKMLEYPALEEMASKESAPFLHGTIALQLSEVVREMTKQATAALAKDGRDGRSVAPMILLTGPPELLAEMASYVQRRGAWLCQHADALGIELPSMEIRELRAATVELLWSEAVRLSG